MTESYPQYRKYKNNKSYFKIDSPEEFEEVQILTKTNKLYRFKASILPDRNYIYDLTFNYEDFAELITKEEYEEIRKTTC